MMKAIVWSQVVIAVTASFFLSQAEARGWPRVENNTLIADNGNRLRGCDFFIWKLSPDKTEYSMQATSYRDIHEQFNFNWVRLCCVFDHRFPPHYTIDETIPRLDRAIDAAEQAGIYVCINYQECASYNIGHLTEFWTRVSERYADRSHVQYEICNEPVAWTADKYRDHHLRDQETIYKIMRNNAPNTPIVLLSYAQANGPMADKAAQLNGIDWTNAVVSFHCYATRSSSAIKELKSRFPCIAGEFMSPHPEMEHMASMDGERYIAKILEELEISWTEWYNGMRKDKFGLVENYIIKDANNRGYMWPSDDEFAVHAARRRYDGRVIGATAHAYEYTPFLTRETGIPVFSLDGRTGVCRVRAPHESYSLKPVITVKR
jgi:hypothetical protein